MTKKNQKGFTLMEMLIVIAIIAILVAIAIPVFSAQLDKARLGVDQANARSIRSGAVALAMTDNITTATTYYGVMDATNNTLTVSTTAPTAGYNQSESNGDPVNGYWYKVVVDTGYNITSAEWVNS